MPWRAWPLAVRGRPAPAARWLSASDLSCRIALPRARPGQRLTVGAAAFQLLGLLCNASAEQGAAAESSAAECGSLSTGAAGRGPRTSLLGAEPEPLRAFLASEKGLRESERGALSR